MGAEAFSREKYNEKIDSGRSFFKKKIQLKNRLGSKTIKITSFLTKWVTFKRSKGFGIIFKKSYFDMYFDMYFIENV